MMRKVTDPEILKQLNSEEDYSSKSSLRKVTDPELLKKLNSEEDDSPSFMHKLPGNIIAGLAQMGHGIINTPHNVVNMISPEAAKHIPKQKNYNYPELLGLPPATTADKIVRNVAQFSPTFGLPVAEMGIAGQAAGLLPRMGAQAVSQGAFGATQNENPLHGAAEGAISGAGGELIGSAGKGAYNALRPSNIFRGNLSKEELKRNLEATKGTNTGLGRVIESPSLNRVHENILPHVIGSGAEDVMQKTANQITQKGENLLEKFRGNLTPGETGVHLQKALKEAAKDAMNEKNEGFEVLNKASNEAGLKVGRESFQNKANEVLKDIELSPELKAEFTPQLYKDLVRYAKNPEGNNLKLTNIFRGKLGDKANELYGKGQMHEYGVVKSLKDALSKDIETSFDNSSNKELKNLYAKNQKDYAEKFAPFEDPDIVKFTRKGGDSDMILPHFLRGGKNDRANLLNKIKQRMPKTTNPLPYAHLSRAVDKEGQFDPIKLSTLYRNLGENQKKVLFPDKITRDELEKYSNLVGKNKETFDLMRNPKTGARNTDLLIKIGQMVGAGTMGGLHGLGGLVAAGLAGKSINKLLTSEKTRTNLIKKMLEEKNLKKPTKVLPGILTMELNQYAGEEK